MSNIINYHIIKGIIGKGKFGSVYRCKRKNNIKDIEDSNDLLAVKIINKNKIKKYNLEDQVGIEIRILETVKHKNIIRLIDFFEDEKKIYIVTDYIKGGELYNILKTNEKIEEIRVVKYIKQVVDTVEYIHSLNIVHRDIKAENILLTEDDNIVLCDFGWSIISETMKCKYNEIVGTVDYLCPEMLSNQGYDYRCDIWSIGVLTYELLSLESPFFSYSHRKTYSKIINIQYEFPLYFSKEAKDFISKALTKNPEDRISIDNMKSHTWILKYNK